MGEPALKRLSYADYVAGEANGEVRHEFLDGEIFAMAGGTLEHSALAAQLSHLLKMALQGRPCRVFNSDARTRVPATGLGTYPDLAVVCGRVRTDPDDPDTLINPVLLVEVLSERTEGWDRGGKFGHYQRLDSLREYLLVSVEPRQLELYRRQADGRWLYERVGPGDVLTLDSVGVTLAADALYAELDALRAAREG